MFCQELTLQGIFNSTEFLDWGLRQTSLLALLSLGFSGSSGISLSVMYKSIQVCTQQQGRKEK